MTVISERVLEKMNKVEFFILWVVLILIIYESFMNSSDFIESFEGFMYGLNIFGIFSQAMYFCLVYVFWNMLMHETFEKQNLMLKMVQKLIVNYDIMLLSKTNANQTLKNTLSSADMTDFKKYHIDLNNK